MGNNLTFARELLWRSHYVDTPFDNLSQIPLVTVDREEVHLPAAPFTYVITIPNNPKAVEQKILEGLEKARKWEEGKTSEENAKNPNVRRFLFVPTDNFSTAPQKNFEALKNELAEIIPKDLRDHSTIAAKVSLKNPNTPLVKFLWAKRDMAFDKSFNVLAFESKIAKDKKSGAQILTSEVVDLS